jgi:hypothetical protein
MCGLDSVVRSFKVLKCRRSELEVQNSKIGPPSMLKGHPTLGIKQRSRKETIKEYA